MKKETIYLIIVVAVFGILTRIAMVKNDKIISDLKNKNVELELKIDKLQDDLKLCKAHNKVYYDYLAELPDTLRHYKKFIFEENNLFVSKTLYDFMVRQIAKDRRKVMYWKPAKNKRNLK